MLLAPLLVCLEETKRMQFFSDFIVINLPFSVLHQVLALIERAKTLQPENSDYMVESGYLQELLGNVGGALQNYKQALKLNESNVPALYGIIKCQILEDNFEEAEQQLEFLNEIQATTGIN